MWCGKPAARYCDAVIGVEPKGASRDKSGNATGLLAGLDGERWTCDAPICAQHTRQAGHICGEQPDSIDHCPHHATHPERPMKDLLIFAGQADARRRAVHAEIRRKNMRAAKMLEPDNNKIRAALADE